MMEDFYIYIIQVNVALLVFYFLFKLLFSRDTFLEIRRLFLLTIVALAFSYPVITFSSGWKIQQPLQVAMVNYVEILTEVATVVAPTETDPVIPGKILFGCCGESEVCFCYFGCWFSCVLFVGWHVKVSGTVGMGNVLLYYPEICLPFRF